MSDLHAQTQPFIPGESTYAPGTHPDLPAPPSTVGVVGWLRTNLFSSVGNSILTLVALAILLIGLPPLLDWTIFDAAWSAKGREDCLKSPDGACWGFVSARFGQFIYGFYPDPERWRVDVSGLLTIILVGMILFGQGKVRAYGALLFLFVYPIISFILLYGGILGLDVVETNKWGGMMLTLVIAITGITASLPLGVLLALGRRSNMPIIKNLCVIFIEFWRGVPLITVLFMTSVMFPLFLPEGVSFNQLLRALIGVALFSAAYMAEVIRGGLQAIPKGQYEAASALGLGYWKSMRLIVLPQALTIVIPGIVNTFIGLFKDTTLVLIIGLIDFLSAVNTGTNDNNWAAPNVPMTAYLFAAIVYFIFCFGMSRYSVRLERKLATGHKR